MLSRTGAGPAIGPALQAAATRSSLRFGLRAREGHCRIKPVPQLRFVCAEGRCKHIVARSGCSCWGHSRPLDGWRRDGPPCCSRGNSGSSGGFHWEAAVATCCQRRSGLFVCITGRSCLGLQGSHDTPSGWLQRGCRGRRTIVGCGAAAPPIVQDTHLRRCGADRRRSGSSIDG